MEETIVAPRRLMWQGKTTIPSCQPAISAVVATKLKNPPPLPFLAITEISRVLFLCLRALPEPALKFAFEKESRRMRIAWAGRCTRALEDADTSYASSGSADKEFMSAAPVQQAVCEVIVSKRG